MMNVQINKKLLHPRACSHQLQHHGHTLPCSKADMVSSIHQTLVTLSTKTKYHLLEQQTLLDDTLPCAAISVQQVLC